MHSGGEEKVGVGALGNSFLISGAFPRAKSRKAVVVTVSALGGVSGISFPTVCGESER